MTRYGFSGFQPQSKRFFSRRFIQSILAVFLLAAAFFILPISAAPPLEDTDYASAVWVAKSDALLKLKTSDGTSLLEVQNSADIQVVDVDDVRGVVWTYAQEKLRATYLRFNVLTWFFY